MVLKVVYVVRHADRVWDLTNAPTLTGIPGDVPLTPHGLDQTRELTDFFHADAEEGDTARPIPDRIYTSAYWRTLQTVHFLPCATDRLYVEPGLGERVLDDGLHPPIPLSSLQTAHFPAIDPAYAPFHLPEPAQESRADLMRRMATVAEELVRRCDADEGVETVLWGTHASPALCLARALLGDDEAEVHTYTAAVSKYVRTDSSRRLGAWKLDWNARCDFLSGGGEMDWSFSKDQAVVEPTTVAPHGQR